MKVRIFGEEIKTLEDWYAYAPPQNKVKHWKDGASAKEFAKYFLKGKGGLPKEISQMLKKLDINFEGNFNCFAERTIKFDNCKGKDRQQDALLIPDDNSFIVSIEAKATEGFEDSKKNIPYTENKQNRIRLLAHNVFGNENYNLDMDIYQLYHSTAGALCEAKEIGADKAILLVLGFKKEGGKVPSKKHLDNYIKALEDTYKTKAPFRLNGYKDIDFYIEYIEVVIE